MFYLLPNNPAVFFVAKATLSLPDFDPQTVFTPHGISFLNAKSGIKFWHVRQWTQYPESRWRMFIASNLIGNGFWPLIDHPGQSVAKEETLVRI